MFNPFADVLWYGQLLVPVILRLVMSYYFVYEGWQNLSNHPGSPRTKARSLFGVSSLVIGILFFFGLFTQLAALAGIILSSIAQFSGTTLFYPKRELWTHTFVRVMCLIIFLLGAGVFSLDLPL